MNAPVDTTAATPSLARGIQPVPRLPPLEFDDDTVPLDWFGGDPALSAAWSSFSVLAEVAEARFMATGRWLVDRIDDSAAAEELSRFMLQEASHSTVHRRLNRVLADKGLPIDESRALCDRVVGELVAVGGPHAMAALSIAAEQAIGEVGHASLAHPAHWDSTAPAVRSLYMWHWYEEVERQAALYDGWRRVVTPLGPGVERRLRWFGIATMLLFVGVLWPVLMVRFASAAGHRLPLRAWSGLVRQLFGRRGLMRRTLRNVLALSRSGFHPFDLQDPRPTLAQWYGVVVDDAWARRFRPPRRHGGQVAEAPTGCTAGGVVRFGWMVLREAWAFHRRH